MTVVADPAANRPPEASFVFFPAGPVAGELITFVSTSTDADSPIPASALDWDLNGDGAFDDAEGPSATTSYAVAGTYTISLRIATNKTDVATLVLNVGAPGVPGTGVGQQALSLMSPFPVVRIAGQFSRRGVRIRRLTIDAPPGTAVKVRCGGRGCPFKRLRRTISLRVRANRELPPTRLLRIRSLEGRLLRPGVKLRLFVTRPGAIGKYTRFEIRRRKSPTRADMCLVPGSGRPLPAPRADPPQPRLKRLPAPTKRRPRNPPEVKWGAVFVDASRGANAFSCGNITEETSPLFDGACCRGRACAARYRERGPRIRLAVGQRRGRATASSAGPSGHRPPTRSTTSTSSDFGNDRVQIFTPDGEVTSGRFPTGRRPRGCRDRRGQRLHLRRQRDRQHRPEVQLLPGVLQGPSPARSSTPSGVADRLRRERLRRRPGQRSGAEVRSRRGPPGQPGHLRHGPWGVRLPVGSRGRPAPLSTSPTSATTGSSAWQHHRPVISSRRVGRLDRVQRADRGRRSPRAGHGLRCRQRQRPGACVRRVGTRDAWPDHRQRRFRERRVRPPARRRDRIAEQRSSSPDESNRVQRFVEPVTGSVGAHQRHAARVRCRGGSGTTRVSVTPVRLDLHVHGACGRATPTAPTRSRPAPDARRTVPTR